MKQHRDFEFNLRDLTVGLIMVNGLNLAGLFIMVGLVNIATGRVSLLGFT